LLQFKLLCQVSSNGCVFHIYGKSAKLAAISLLMVRDVVFLPLSEKKNIFAHVIAEQLNTPLLAHHF